MSSKTPLSSQLLSTTSSSAKYSQLRLLSNNRINSGLILLNRQILVNHLLTNRQNPTDNHCNYLHRFCLQSRLEGYNYCIRHILCDRNAPFRQCSYINPHTSKRCPNAARRLERRDNQLCFWHTKKLNLDKRKEFQRQFKRSPVEAVNQESLKHKFEELEHYCPSNDHDHRRKNVDWDMPEERVVTASKKLRTKIAESIGSQSEQSNVEDQLSNTSLSEVLNLDILDSDNEGADTYMDDPLRHAGIYTAEEIAHILRNKMLRLQTLYINLLNYYRHLLKNKTFQYYLDRINNKTTTGQVETTIPPLNATIDSLAEQKDLEMLKAMHEYHNISGEERIMRDAYYSIRQSSIEEGEQKAATSISTPSYTTCIYPKKESVLCQQRCIPLSNYCKEHILYDPNQVLYRPCAGGSPPCLSPIISYVHKNHCVRHAQLKYDQTELDRILKSPNNNMENTDGAHSLVPVNNQSRLFQPIDDIDDGLMLEMEPVASGNLFSINNFDLEDSDILS